MEGISIYSALMAAASLIAWGYILSLRYLSSAWDTVLNKVVEMPPANIPVFFANNQQWLIRLGGAAIILQIAVVILPFLNDRLKPRWYSHIAALALAYLAFGPTTFTPVGVHPPAPAATPGKAHAKP